MNRKRHHRPSHRRRASQADIGYGQIALFAAAAFAGTWALVPQVQSFYSVATMSEAERTAVEQSVYYPGCDQVRAEGRDPLYAGQPGYRTDMDGDGDGIACEPHT